MNARSDTSPGDPSVPPEQAQRQQPTAGAPAEREERRAFGLTAAVVVAGVGALFVGLAPVVGLVTPPASPAFPSWPLLLGLALVPPGMAVAFLRRRRHGLAAAVLLGPAALAPGRLVLDAQLVMDAGLAARPELLLPTSLDPLAPAAGLWLLLAGQVAAGVAGVLAMNSREPADQSAGSVFAATESEAGESGVRRQGLLALVLCATVAAAVGVLMAQFVSDNPYLLPRAAVDAPLFVLIGSLLVALALPSAGGFVVSSADPDLARGGLLGLAAAVAAVVVPPLFAVAVRADLHYSWGPMLGLIAALALVVLAVPAGRATTRESASDLRLPALPRLLTISGALAVLAGVLALVGAMTPQLEMPADVGEPSPYPARMLWPGGLVVGLLGVGLLLPRTAAMVRPVLAVAWAALPLAAAAALDTVFTALQAAGAHAGIGAWAAGLSVVVAVLAAIAAALGGAVERDDIDLTEVTMRRAVVAPALTALLLGVGAFSLPVVTAPEYTPPGIFTKFGTTSWGLVIALLSVVAAAVLAPICRSARAAALVSGAALVVLVRVLELPLTAARAAGSGPGLGLWCGLACIVVLLVTAALAARDPEARGPAA